MKLTLQSKFSQYTAILITILISFMLIMDSAKSWFSYIYAGDPPPNGLKDAYSLESGNAEFYFLLAQYYNFYDYTFPRENIYPLYKKALELNPFNYVYWYSLAQFLSMQDRKDDARFALNEAVELSPGVVALRWEAAMMASELGDSELIKENLASVITYDPHRQKKAYILLWASLKNGDEILQIIPENAYLSYLHFLISTKRKNEAIKLWDKIEHKNSIPESLFVRYVNFLLFNHELERAVQAWTERLGGWDGIWNGDFEKSILNGGFDWRINNTDGSEAARKFDASQNTHLMEIDFDGENHAAVQMVSQNVPVNANTLYAIDIKQKSKELSTGTGLYWEVYCPSDSKLLARTNNIRGSSDWRNLSLTFKTSYGCDLVSVRLISGRTDKKMSGTLWIDKVAMKETN